MLKKILGTIVGILVAGIMVGLVEALGHLIFPPPPGTDLKDPEALSQIMHIIPIGAKVAVLVAWFVGALSGGLLAITISKWSLSPWIVSAAMFAGSVYSLVAIPHPIWMAIAAFILPVVAAYLAVRIHMSRSQNN